VVPAQLAREPRPAFVAAWVYQNCLDAVDFVGVDDLVPVDQELASQCVGVVGGLLLGAEAVAVAAR
jgi:hypothetical protein